MAEGPSNTQPIHVGQDFYVPSFRVFVRNQELLEEQNDIMSVSYTDSLDKIDSFELTVNNWDAEKRSFKYNDDDDNDHTFDPLQNVEIWMGYFRGGNDERQRMLTGEITTLSPNFSGTSAPTLGISGLNLLHRFRSAQVAQTFLKKKDTEIAQTLIDAIAAEVRKHAPNTVLELDGQDKAKNLASEQPLDSILVPNVPPIDFLMKRARCIGYELFIEEAPRGSQRLVTVHYRPPKETARPTYRLEWGKTLLSFQPTLQTARQVSEVTVRGWNPKTKSEIVGKATRTSLGDDKLIQLSDLKIRDDALTQKQEIVVDRPIQSQAEANTLAEQTLRQIMQDLIEARGRTLGRPDLRAGTKIEITDLGQRFSGTYLVTGTTHVIGDGGYTTDFTARKEKA